MRYVSACIQKYVPAVAQVLLLLSVVCMTTSNAHAIGWETVSLKSLVDFIISVVGGALIPIAIMIVFFLFVYGIVQYLRAANTGSKDMKDEAKNRLLYPVLAIFILFTLWGSVDLLRVLFTKGG